MADNSAAGAHHASCRPSPKPSPEPPVKNPTPSPVRRPTLAGRRWTLAGPTPPAARRATRRGPFKPFLGSLTLAGDTRTLAGDTRTLAGDTRTSRRDAPPSAGAHPTVRRGRRRSKPKIFGGRLSPDPLHRTYLEV